MTNISLNSVFILLFIPLIVVYAFPCPSECVCKAADMPDVDFTRMIYTIDCSNVPLNDNKLVHHAEPWSIHEDKINAEYEPTNDYIIFIDLTNSSSLKYFNNQTIVLTDFSFRLQSLSLTTQSNTFILQSNAFNSSLYDNLQILNLSSCCRQIPIECQQLFSPLKKLQLLDLSGSDMYKTCLDNPDTISSTLRDLILRNNDYDTTTFSHSSQLFEGVRRISGRLDLQYSRFQIGSQLTGNCLFDLFNRITELDLSFVQFQSTSNDTEIHLKHLINCKKQNENIRNGEQLLYLHLRQLNLQHLPEWFTTDRFPLLRQLDLSNNQLHSIDLSILTSLRHVSLAWNPIEFDGITWRSNVIYESINLQSTNTNRTFNLTTRLEKLFNLTTNIDYSDNLGENSFDLRRFSIAIDFSSSELSLNLSRTNISSFEFQDFSRLDDLYRLDLSHNHLNQLNLEQQRKLSYLQCSNQNLTSLILNRENSNLIELNCSKNSLTTIENFSSMSHEKLQLIDLSYNSVETIDNLFSNVKSRYFHTINLKSNRIRRISSGQFQSKWISLYSIDLSENQIDFIGKSSFQSPNLQMLDLTGNPLTTIEPNFIFTSSLRVFLIINHTQEFIERCAQSTGDDTLLLTYMTWFEQNGTYMKTAHVERSQQIQLDKCLYRYTSRSKVKWMKITDKHQIKHLSLYITMGVISVGIILAMIYLYRKNKLSLVTSLQQYRPLDRNSLVENTDDINQHQREDDEIVMNLNEPPFNNIHRV